MDARERITAIFEREMADAEANHETSAFIGWLGQLRDETLAALE